MARICLITPNPISFQPRTVREADALHEAGHSVRVIACQMDDALVALDAEVMRSRRWRLQVVDLRRSTAPTTFWLRESVQTRIARVLFQSGMSAPAIARYAYVKGTASMARLASSEPADWFVAHNHAALPIAAEVAGRQGARLGFDCEDLLTESDIEPSDLVRWIERRFLHTCDYVSAPSRQIADRLAADYRIPKPIVLYNTQPPALADGVAPPENRRRLPGLRLHWVSQTIGPGRGLEEVIRSLAALPPAVEVHLRGAIRPEFKNELVALAARAQAQSRLMFLPVVDPARVVGEMGAYDVGLAVEVPERVHYALTVSNKIFAYLLAGLAIAATDLPGHREVIQQIPDAGFLYRPGDTAALVSALRRWLEDPGQLVASQRAAWRAARETFSWEMEKHDLLGIFSAPREAARS